VKHIAVLDCAVTIGSLLLVDMLALDLPFNGIILILELSQFWGLGLLPSSNEIQILIFVSLPCDRLDPWCFFEDLFKHLHCCGSWPSWVSLVAANSLFCRDIVSAGS